MSYSNNSVMTTPELPLPTATASSDEIFQNLYPAIIQAFVIILAGYVAGRTGMVTQTQSKGISTFVSKFALPALILKSMIELDFTIVNWKFVCSLFLGKASVFGIVLFFSLLLQRPVNLGKGAINAIFSTQSNDFAIGFPIVQAIYQTTHPEYLPYIYLAVPISIAILNPIGFLLLEIEKQRSQPNEGGTNKLRLVWHVVKDVITNPIVFMVVVGIIGNFIFQHNVPAVLTEILKVLSDSFSATALFYLGFTLVGKLQALKGLALVTPCLLIVAKTLLLPFITREFVYVLDAGDNANETLSYSMFGFLYGTFPSAPTVLIYASTYGTSVDTISTGMVLCTFVSAPLMFVSAKMVTLQNVKQSENMRTLIETSLDISILGIVCTAWVAVVFILGRKWRVFPHQFTVFLLLSQFLACLGNILWNVTDHSVPWQHYTQFIIFFVGVLSSRTWTSMCAVGMCLLRVRSLCYVLRMRWWLIIYGFGVPVICTGFLLICSPAQWTTVDPSFQYGSPQTIVSAIILAVSLVITVVALVIQQRNDRKHKEYKHLTIGEGGERTNTVEHQQDSSDDKTCASYGACCNDSGNSGKNTDSTSRKGGKQPETSIEDIVPWSDMQTSDSEQIIEEDGTLSENMCLVGNCSAKQRQECRNVLKTYHTINSTGSEADPVIMKQTEAQQIGHHLVLLFLLIVSLGIALFLCTWRLFHEEYTGLFIELEFLDSFFNFGQAFFVFAVFGLDTKLIIIPFVKRLVYFKSSLEGRKTNSKLHSARWRRLVYGAENIHLPRLEDLDEDTRHVCEQFNTYHKEKCIFQLQTDKRYRLRVYKNVFMGTDLVAWLQEVGLATDAMEAVIYGQRLVLGRIIHHVTDEHQFYDLPYFYRFIENETTA